jgi:hypothetical protein
MKSLIALGATDLAMLIGQQAPGILPGIGLQAVCKHCLAFFFFLNNISTRWGSNLGKPHTWASSTFFFLKIYLFIICKYIVAVFRHSRRGRQILLQMVVSHHVVAGIWTSDLRKSSLVLLPTEPSHQPRASSTLSTKPSPQFLAMEMLIVVYGALIVTHTRSTQRDALRYNLFTLTNPCSHSLSLNVSGKPMWVLILSVNPRSMCRVCFCPYVDSF